jgi:hypothetical protein
MDKTNWARKLIDLIECGNRLSDINGLRCGKIVHGTVDD